MLSKRDVQLSRVIFELIKNSTSQNIVKDFLEAHGVPKTAANWDEYYSKRILPALEEGKFSIVDLRGLLQRVEEHGRQHIFLYNCTPERAELMLGKSRAIDVARSLGVESVFDEPKDLDLPDSPQIVDIRFHKIMEPNIGRTLTIKLVETRNKLVYAGERMDKSSGRYVKEYTVEKKRAINIARLHENGLLELRIASRDNTVKYLDDVKTFFSKISKFFPLTEFKSVSLTNAKDTLVKHRDALVGVRYSHSSARNDYGCIMNIATSSQEDNLSTDAGSMGAIGKFLDEDGFVTGANVYLEIPQSQPKREIHTLLSGEDNEFSIPVACTPEDYDFVLGKILTINKKVSRGGAGSGAGLSASIENS